MGGTPSARVTSLASPTLDVFEVLEHAERTYGERLAVVDGSSYTLTYAQLHARTQSLAEFLLGRGCGRGSRVAVMMRNRSAVIEVRLKQCAIWTRHRLLPIISSDRPAQAGDQAHSGVLTPMSSHPCAC